MPAQPSSKDAEEMEAEVEGDSPPEMHLNGEEEESEDGHSGSQTESESESSGEPPCPALPLRPAAQAPPSSFTPHPASPRPVPQKWTRRTTSAAVASASTRCWT